MRDRPLWFRAPPVRALAALALLASHRPGRRAAGALAAAPRVRRPGVRQHPAPGPEARRTPGALHRVARRTLPRLVRGREPADRYPLRRDRAGAPGRLPARHARAAHVLPRPDQLGALREERQRVRVPQGPVGGRERAALLPGRQRQRARAHERRLHPRLAGVGARRPARRLLRQRARRHELRRLRGGRDLRGAAAASGRRPPGDLVRARLVPGRRAPAGVEVPLAE